MEKYALVLGPLQDNFFVHVRQGFKYYMHVMVRVMPEECLALEALLFYVSSP